MPMQRPTRLGQRALPLVRSKSVELRESALLGFCLHLRYGTARVCSLRRTRHGRRGSRSSAYPWRNGNRGAPLAWSSGRRPMTMPIPMSRALALPRNQARRLDGGSWAASGEKGHVGIRTDALLPESEWILSKHPAVLAGPAAEWLTPHVVLWNGLGAAVSRSPAATVLRVRELSRRRAGALGDEGSCEIVLHAARRRRPLGRLLDRDSALLDPEIHDSRSLAEATAGSRIG